MAENTYIKRIVIAGGPLGLSSAQVFEESIAGGVVTPLPAKLLDDNSSLKAIIDDAVISTLAANASLQSEIDALGIEKEALEAQVLSLQSQLSTLPEPGEIIVTRAQAKLALQAAGLLESVETAIASIEDAQQKAVATIAWQEAPNFSRSSTFVAMLGTMLGLSSEQIDNLFEAAAAISL